MNNEKRVFKRILPNISFLFFGGILSSVFIFASQVILARQLSTEGYGAFSSAFATITLLGPLAIFGVGHSWLKLYGIEGVGANRWLKVSLKMLVLTFTVTVLISTIWAFIGPHNLHFRFFLLGLLPLIISHIFTELVNTRFQLEGRYGALAIWQNFIHFLRFLFITLAAIFFIKPLAVIQVVLAYSFISIVVSILGYFLLSSMLRGKINLKILKGKSSKENISGDQLNLSQMFVQSMPFGLAGLFYLVYLQSDLIFLKYLVNDTAAGIYAAAFAVLLVVYFIPGVIYQKFLLPKIHGWANHNEKMLLAVYQAGNGIMLLMGLIIFVVLFLISPIVIPIIFGEEYKETSFVLNILLFCIPLRFLATSIESPLFTKDLMKWKTGSMGLVAFLNIILNFILIPPFSFYGAAAATLISEFVVLILYLLIIYRKLFGINAFLGWTNGFNSSFWKSIS